MLNKKRQGFAQKQQELARVKSEIARKRHLMLHTEGVRSHDNHVTVSGRSSDSKLADGIRVELDGGQEREKRE